MRRQVQILCVAGAALVAGGSLWAIASSDMLGHFGQYFAAPTNEASTVRSCGDFGAGVITTLERAIRTDSGN